MSRKPKTFEAGEFVSDMGSVKNIQNMLQNRAIDLKFRGMSNQLCKYSLDLSYY